MNKKKIGICSILGGIRIQIRIQNRTRIRIHHPGSGSADPDPDPHQMIRIRNTGRNIMSVYQENETSPEPESMRFASLAEITKKQPDSPP